MVAELRLQVALLTDEQWQEMLQNNQAPDVPSWVKPYLINSKVEVDETNLYSSGC